MKRTILGAAVLAAGCFQYTNERATDYWGGEANVIGGRKAPKQDIAAAWRGEADPWKGIGKLKKTSPDVIGGRSALASDKGRAAAKVGARSAPAVGRSDPGAAREVQVLAARVERLERMVSSGGAPAPAAAPQRAAPSAAIYKVHPDGRVAWIAAGSSSGIREGQTYRVMRGETAVAQVRVSRVWPQVSELAVLVANGQIQRGDSVVAAK